MKSGQLLGPLQEKPFRFQFLANASSTIGDNLVPVALAFAILGVTGSATDLGLVLAARTVALVLFLLVGGVWADRIPRQRLMMASDLGRATTQGVLGALLISGHAELWHFFVLETSNGAATAFFRPAEVGLTPKTVTRERLQQANALLSLTHSSAGILGPAVAGVLVATLGAGWALSLDAATFVISAFFLTRIKLPPSAQKVEPSTFFADLAAGWGEVRSRSWVWISILNFMTFQLLALPAFFVLGPFIADRSLGGASAWATVLVLAGVGSIIGDLLALRVKSGRPLRLAFLSMLLAPPVLVLLGLEAPVWMIAAAALLWGISMTYFNTIWFTVLQEHIPDRSLSRVSSYDWLGSTALRPLGFAMAGPLAASVGDAEMLIGIALIIATIEITTAFVPSISGLTIGPLKEQDQSASIT